MRQSHIGKQLTRFSSFLLLALLSCQGLAAAPNIDRIVVFGASLSDTGNAFVWLARPGNSACGTSLNMPPYDALDDLLVPDGPYAKGGHHFTNGATWVEGLARYMALAGNTRPALQNDGMKASNYAVGGARAIANFPCRYNLPAQVDTYLSDFGSASDGTLVAMEIGGNDVRDALIVALTGGNSQQNIRAALTSFYMSVFNLYHNGKARRFLVLNVPDIGKTPAVRAIDRLSNAGGFIVNLAGTLANGYNAGLAETVAQLRQLQGIEITILDVHQTFDDVIANPQTYGFTNATDPCITPNQPPYKCHQPDEYIFWDGIHPTKALHAIVAQQAAAIISAP